MFKIPIAVPSVLAVALWVMPAEAAMTEKDKAELATVVAGSKVTLEQGLATSKKNGKPVSIQVRDRERRAAALGLHRQGGLEVFRGDRRPKLGRDRQS